MKVFTGLLAVVLMAGLMACPTAVNAQDNADPEAIVVTVNGKEITEQYVADETQKQIQAQARQMPSGMEINEWMRNQIRIGVVDMIIQQALIEEKLADKEIAIGDESVQEEIAQIAASQNLDPEQLQAEVARYGMTMDDLEKQIRLRLQIEALIEEEMEDKDIDDEAVRSFYDENPQHFEQPEQVRVAHILILTQDKTEQQKAEALRLAEDVLQKARDGEDFAELVRAYSEDPGSKDQGGEYTFPRGQMVPEFEQVAFTLEEGQISDLVETMYGYHIIKKRDHIDAVKRSFEDAEPVIRDYLVRQKRGRFWEDYIEKLHADADIEFSESEKQLRQSGAQPGGMPQMTP